MATSYERHWETRRRGGRGDGGKGGRTAGDEARNSYYGVPAIHGGEWKWMIAIYFFLGGLTSGSYIVATIARWFGGSTGQPIARAGRYVSFAALLPCPLLLILDLGRPERFLYMLRVFKLRSPMSMGVWGLLGYSGFATLASLTQAADDGLLGWIGWPRKLLTSGPVRLLALPGIGFASFFGGYTGVLLAATAVPLWARSALMLGPLFLTSGVSSGTAAIALVLALSKGTPREALGRLHRLNALGLLLELGLTQAIRVRAGHVIGRPLHTGRLGRIEKYGVTGLGILVPLALQWKALVRGEAPSRLSTAAASILVLAGGLALRCVMVFAGRASADDPEATFEFARADDAG
jgi:formate-dependent nitrite reductase membrane component NrfD